MKVKQRNEYPVQQPGPTGPPVVIGTEVFEADHTNPVWGGSGGVRIRLHNRFALRPEAGVLFSLPSNAIFNRVEADNFVDIRFGVSAIASW
jgi:hypothetical protein